MSTPTTIRREITVETKILDATTGLVEYVASDESVDSYGEVIRAAGWKFSRFSKNAPFVDSHRYNSVEDLLGKVVDFRVDGKRLVETVQWAVDVQANHRARIGWEMTRAGYLKAVSVGFYPVRMASRWDQDKTTWMQQLKELNLHEEDGVRAVYLEQEQIELSAVVVGANPNALLNISKAYKSGALSDSDLRALSQAYAHQRNDPSPATTPQPAADASTPGHASSQARAQDRERFLKKVHRLVGGL